MDEFKIVQGLIGVALGAVIAGIAALVVSTRNNKHDLRRMRLEAELEFLKEVVSNFDRATCIVNDYTAQLAARSVKSDATSSCAGNSLLAQASECISKSRSGCHILGMSWLGALIADYAGRIDQIEDAIRQKDSLSYDYLEENANARLEIRLAVECRLRDAFDGLFVTRPAAVADSQSRVI